MADADVSSTAPMAAIAGVDHCVLGVADLEAARTRYRDLGFTVTPRGRHIGWATANYCVMFPRDYIELLGIVAPGAYSAGLDAILSERGEGILKLALASGDAEAAHAFLSAAGLVSAPVAELARELEAPEGTVLPAFRLVHPLPEATPGLPAFLCQHLSRELVWRKEWCRHRNGATGVAACAILAEDPAALADGWARLYGAGAVRPGHDRLTVETGTARLEFLTAVVLAAAFEGLEIGSPVAGTIVAMTLAVTDLAATAACLAEAGIACRRNDHGLVVPPEEACGVILAFEAGGLTR